MGSSTVANGEDQDQIDDDESSDSQDSQGEHPNEAVINRSGQRGSGLAHSGGRAQVSQFHEVSFLVINSL